MKILLVLLGALCARAADGQKLKFELTGSYSTGVFNQGAAEIVAYDSGSQRLFIVNGAARAIDVPTFQDLYRLDVRCSL